jgi:PhnB protein
MKAQPIPAGYHTVTPYLMNKDASKVLAFAQKAFGAEVVAKTEIDGVLLNAEVRIGDSMVMIADCREHSPRPATLYLYVKNVDELYQSAVRAGGNSIMEPTDQFYGDRSGGVEDAAGNQWWIATRVEDVSPEEVARRVKGFRKS